jgi:hypothetical protein
VLGAIARVEDAVTLNTLLDQGQRQSIPMGKIAQAYGNLLRYAGVRVTDEEIYFGMFGNEATAEGVSTALYILVHMMLPPSAQAKLLDFRPGQADAEALPGNFHPATAEAS